MCLSPISSFNDQLACRAYCPVVAQVVFWASASKTVLGRRQRRLGRLVLEERSRPVTDEQALPALLQVRC
jgi:hypothetical protein